MADPGVALVATSPMLKIADVPSASSVLSLLSVTPPQAPTNLQGQVSQCRVKLLWEDNAAQRKRL